MSRRVSSKKLCMVFFALIIIKLSLVAYTWSNGLWAFGQGNDADYYHNYALGNVQSMANTWSELLRVLNSYGLYSRVGVKIFVVVLGFVVIPIMVAGLSTGGRVGESRSFWMVAGLVSLYPTLGYYALDIYRDAVLCFMFLLALFVVQKFFVAQSANVRLAALIIIVFMSYVMFLFRPYLGASFTLALLGSSVLYRLQWPLWWCVLVYLLALNGLYALGGLDQVLAYRSKFESALKGGSNLGIVFDSIPFFIPVFLKNFAIQMLGFYFSNALAWIVFLVESVAFMSGAAYLIVNRRFADRLVAFLVVFAVIYGSIWLIGNDNMGTAIRLRLCNYLAVVVCVATVYLNKKKHALQEEL